MLPGLDLRFLRGGGEAGGEDIGKLMMSRHTICCNFAVMVSRMASGWAPEPLKGFGSNAHLKNQLRQDPIGCLRTTYFGRIWNAIQYESLPECIPENEKMAGSAAVVALWSIRIWKTLLDDGRYHSYKGLSLTGN